MQITADTWAVVLATALGPVLAVALTLRREAVNGLYNRRLHVFRVLMATRKIPISNDHVNALNLVEVDFYHCPSVVRTWNAYKEHLNDRHKPEDEVWRESKERLLANLLFEIAKVLKFDIPAMEIFRGGYAPEGWAWRDQVQVGTFKFFADLANKKAEFPIWINGITGSDQQAQNVPRPEPPAMSTAK